MRGDPGGARAGLETIREGRLLGTLEAGIRICAHVKWYFRGIGDIAILQSLN